MLGGKIPADVGLIGPDIIITLETCGGNLKEEYALYNCMPLVEFLWWYAEAKQLI
jgi:hypothetical protein